MWYVVRGEWRVAFREWWVVRGAWCMVSGRGVGWRFNKLLQINKVQGILWSNIPWPLARVPKASETSRRRTWLQHLR